MRGVQPETVVVAVGIRRRHEAHVHGIVFAPADEETSGRASPGGNSIWYSVGTEPLCRNGARGPHAFERPRLVAGDFLRQIERAESFEALLRGVVDAVVGVEAVLDEDADQVQRQPFAEFLHVELRQRALDVVDALAQVPQQVDADGSCSAQRSGSSGGASASGTAGSGDDAARSARRRWRANAAAGIDGRRAGIRDPDTPRAAPAVRRAARRASRAQPHDFAQAEAHIAQQRAREQRPQRGLQVARSTGRWPKGRSAAP